MAHPGHELRLHRWITLNQPHCVVLTDGSGSSGPPRTDRSREILGELGCTISGLFGRYSDKEIYDRIRAKDISFFDDLVSEISADLQQTQATMLVSDMAEGFNSTHDLVRCLASVAAGPDVEHWEFALESDPWQAPTAEAEMAKLELDDAEFEAKLQAARAYPELAFELQRAEAAGGLDRFRREALFKACGNGLCDHFLENEPHYETYGRAQVEKGVYRDLISYKEHVRPIMQGLVSRVTA